MFFSLLKYVCHRKFCLLLSYYEIVESQLHLYYIRGIFFKKTHTHKLGYLSGQCHRLWWLTSHRIIWYLGCFDVISIYICCRWWFSFVIPILTIYFLYTFLTFEWPVNHFGVATDHWFPFTIYYVCLDIHWI